MPTDILNSLALILLEYFLKFLQQLERYAKGKVAEGLYSSMSELMRDALRLLRRNDIEYLHEMNTELKQAAHEIEQGDITPLNMQGIMDEVNASLADVKDIS